MCLAVEDKDMSMHMVAGILDTEKPLHARPWTEFGGKKKLVRVADK